MAFLLQHLQYFRRNGKREARIDPLNEHKMQHGRTGKTAECSDTLPYVRRVAIVVLLQRL